MKLSEIATEKVQVTSKIEKVTDSWDDSFLARTADHEHKVWIGEGLAPSGLQGRCIVLKGEWDLSRYGGNAILKPI